MPAMPQHQSPSTAPALIAGLKRDSEGNPEEGSRTIHSPAAFIFMVKQGERYLVTTGLQECPEHFLEPVMPDFFKHIGVSIYEPGEKVDGPAFDPAALQQLADLKAQHEVKIAALAALADEGEAHLADLKKQADEFTALITENMTELERLDKEIGDRKAALAALADEPPVEPEKKE